MFTQLHHAVWVLTRCSCDVMQEFPEVGAALKPLMDTYGVDAYLCGHEHNLQHLHIETERTHYIVSGGGSQSNADGFVDEERPELRLFHPGSGQVRSRASLACN